MKIALIVVLAVALAASVAAGLLGLWPDLRSSGDSTADRREKVRIADGWTRRIHKFGDEDNLYVSRVQLGYLPHRALVSLKYFSTGRTICLVTAEDFGDRVDNGDFERAPCDY